MRQRIAAVLAAAAVGLVGVGAARAEAAHDFVTPSLVIPEPNGYVVSVRGFGNKVTLTVGREHNEELLTQYLTHGRVSGGKIEASFGAFGRISMRFRPSGNAEQVGVCVLNHHEVVRRGRFVGNLNFDGENDYVSVHAHSTRGDVVSLGSRCRGHRGSRKAQKTGSGRKPDRGYLSRTFFAAWRHGPDSAEFLGGDALGGTVFSARSAQVEGDLAIVREASAFGKLTDFALEDTLTQAMVSPPPPFHGTGSYAAAPDGTKTWEGSLSVNFLGAPEFALTGPPFEPVLEAAFFALARNL
jgi:hypothetical protein